MLKRACFYAAMQHISDIGYVFIEEINTLLNLIESKEDPNDPIKNASEKKI